MYVQSKEKTGKDVWLWNLNAYPQWHTTPCSKAKPPKPLYMPPPTGTHIQTLVSMGEFSFRPSQTENCRLINLLCCHMLVCTCACMCMHEWIMLFECWGQSQTFFLLYHHHLSVDYDVRKWYVGDMYALALPSLDLDSCCKFLCNCPLISQHGENEFSSQLEHHPTRPVYQSFVTPLSSHTLHSLETILFVDFYFFCFLLLLSPSCLPPSVSMLRAYILMHNLWE